jgi:glyoxylate reductase
VARCFVTRRLPGDALGRLSAEHEVEVWPERLPPPHDELVARCAESEGLLSLLTDQVDRALIENSPKLRAISNYATGWNNIDIDAAGERGIPVGHTPGVLTETTADLTFALILSAARRILESEREVREGDWLTWEPDRLLGQDVHGATLGIVGPGRIGNAVARRAEGFGMRVLRTRRVGGTPLEELLRASDYVSLHVPLTADTHHLIGDAELALMKPTAILVNTARGPIVDEDALVRALEQGQIGGAALDVTDPEPLPADHPLLSAPGALVVPHIGSASRQTREKMADAAVDNLLAALRGEPMPNCANAGQLATRRAP